MDTELRAISALLYSNRNEQQEFFVSKIPRSVFSARSLEIGWIYSFREKYGEFPSAKAFSDRFGERLKKVKDPLGAALQPVLDMAMYEQMRKLQEKAKKMMDDGKEISSVMQFMRSDALRLQSFQVSHSDINTGTSMGAEGRYREMVFAMEHATVIDSPWATMNKLVKFFRPGEVIGLSARMALGKSWIVTNWAEYWAQKGIRTGVFSKEMPGGQFEDRTEAIRYRFDYDLFRDGSLPPSELRKWRNRKRSDLAKGVNIPLFIFQDEPGAPITLETVAAKVREYRLEAVWIDGAYLIRPEELRADIAPTQRFMFISNRAKEVAKAERVVLGLVVQDNREAEHDDGTARGNMGSIYGSDAWGQDADWFFNVQGKRGGDRRTIELMKGRESKLGEVSITFDLSPPSFRDMGAPLKKIKKGKKDKAQADFKPLK